MAGWLRRFRVLKGCRLRLQLEGPGERRRLHLAGDMRDVADLYRNRIVVGGFLPGPRVHAQAELTLKGEALLLPEGDLFHRDLTVERGVVVVLHQLPP